MGYVAYIRSRHPVGHVVRNEVGFAVTDMAYFQTFQSTFTSREDVLVHEQIILPLIRPGQIEHDVHKLDEWQRIN